MPDKKDKNENTKASYKIEDAIQVADDIFKLSNEKKYNIGAFVHGLIFATEYLQQNLNIPQQQIAKIKRGCRNYFKELNKIKKEK